MRERGLQPGRLGLDVVVSTGGLVSTKVFAAVGGVLSARLLGPTGKGELAVAMLCGNALGIAGTSGLEYWTAREVAASVERWPSVVDVWRRHLRLIAAGTVALAALGVFALATWSSRLAVIGLATLLFAVTTIVSMLHLAVLGGMRRVRRVAIATTFGSAAYPVGIGVLLALSLDSVALAVLASAATTTILAVAAGRPDRHLTRGAHVASARSTTRTYATALRFGYPAAVGDLLALAVARVDVVLLATIANSAAAGRYAVASSLTELLWVVPNAASQVLLPHVAARPERKDTAKLVRISVALMLLGGVILVTIGPELITALFGDAFREASAALPPLVAAAVALGIWKVLLADVVARGDSAARAATAFTGLVAMLSSDLVLVPRYGLVGAGIGSMIGYSVAAAHVVHRWGRRTGGRGADLVAVKSWDTIVLARAWRRGSP